VGLQQGNGIFVVGSKSGISKVTEDHSIWMHFGIPLNNIYLLSLLLALKYKDTFICKVDNHNTTIQYSILPLFTRCIS